MAPLTTLLSSLRGRKTPQLNTKSLLGVVLQCDHNYAFLQDDTGGIATSSPIILNTDDVSEHVLYQIEHILQQRDIQHDHIFLVPHEISFRPLVDLSLHLAIVTLPQEEFIRASVNGFTAVSASQVSMFKEGNVFFDLLSRHQDTLPSA